MTLDRDFERIASAWLADGPTELSDRVLDAVVDEIHLTRQRRAARVPWRFPTMSMPARVAALIAVGALAIAGAVALSGIGGLSRTNQTTPPSAAPAVVAPSGQAVRIPALTNTFTSPRLGYSVKYPAGWTTTAATAVWQWGQTISWGDAAMDVLQGTAARLSVDTERIPPAPVGSAPMTEIQALSANCMSGAGIGTTKAACDAEVARWPTIKIGALDGRLSVDGDLAPAAVGKVGESRMYDAYAVVGGRLYDFTLVGTVDRPYFEALLGTVQLDPANAIDLAPLAKTFTSTTYGYSIAIAPSWKGTSTKKIWRDYSNGDFFDTIGIVGDTGIGIMSQALGSRTFDGFVNEFYAEQLAAIGVSCAGGGPSTWPDIQIGDKTGKVEFQCGSDEALVQAGNRVYLFELGNRQNPDPGFSEAEWKFVLRGVTFDPSKAKS